MKHRSKRNLFRRSRLKLQQSFKRAIKKAQTLSKLNRKVIPSSDDSPDNEGENIFTFTDPEEKQSSSGILYDFREGAVFGELAALGVLPKRIYNAVAVCETELWTLRRIDLLDAFVGADEYVYERAK